MAARAASGAHALACLRPVPNDRLEIRDDPAKGRGVFARQPIPGGTLIEAAPVIIVPAEQCPLLDRTILHDYYFQWDNFDRSGRGAVPLRLVALCNHSRRHSRRPNARVRRNLAQDTLDLVAAAPIAAARRGDDRLSLPALVRAAGLKPQVMKVLLSGRRCAPQRAAARPAAGADEPRPVSLRPRAVAGTGNPHCNSGRGNGRSRAPRRIETPNEPRRGSRPIRRGAVRTEKTGRMLGSRAQTRTG